MQQGCAPLRTFQLLQESYAHVLFQIAADGCILASLLLCALCSVAAAALHLAPAWPAFLCVFLLGLKPPPCFFFQALLWRYAQPAAYRALAVALSGLIFAANLLLLFRAGRAWARQIRPPSHKAAPTFNFTVCLHLLATFR